MMGDHDPTNKTYERHNWLYWCMPWNWYAGMYRPRYGGEWVAYPWRWGIHRCPCGCGLHVLAWNGVHKLMPKPKLQSPIDWRYY